MGLLLVICGFLFIDVGSKEIVYKPTQWEEDQIMEKKKKAKLIEKLEKSLSEGGKEDIGDKYFDKEENTNIRKAIDWKRHHFFVACIIVTIFLMLKFEYSYTKMFAENITFFLIMFVIIDIFLE